MKRSALHPKYGEYTCRATHGGYQGGDAGARLTPDEVEFGRAMDQYKRLNNRPFPTYSEVLDVLISLGYRKVSHGSLHEQLPVRVDHSDGGHPNRKDDCEEAK